MILITVLFMVILILVVFSAMTYQRSVDIQDANNNSRAVLSYVTTAVKANFGSRITLEERDGIRLLAIEEGDTGYEQQIFWSDGQVLENYAKTGTVPKSDNALVIGQAESFALSLEEDDLLKISTDIGTSYVHLRSNG